jgi:catechol 2,3-dioxygenase-like lactoylglutathione lyase family enzyme
MKLRLGSLARVVLLVRDFSCSVEFYERVLGLDKLEERPGWAVFQAGDVLLCLRGPWPDMPFDLEDCGKAPDELLFLVADAEIAKRALEELGMEVQAIHGPGPGLRVAEFRDPDGRRIAIEERASHGMPGSP